MTRYFVTGTDTDVGKTMVSAVMTLALQGYYWKPIQSGGRDDDFVKNITQLPARHFLPSQYSFKAALSPDQAAALENITIDLAHCPLPSQTPLVVEGAGGVWVPLNQQNFMIDFIKSLKIPTVVVARGTVGTINHTLLTLHALRQHEIPIQGVVFNGELNPDNQKTIEKWGKVKTLFHVPHISNLTTQSFRDWVAHASPIIRGALV